MREKSDIPMKNGGWFHTLDGLVHDKTLPIPVKGRGPGITLETLALDRCLDLEKLKVAGWQNFIYQNKPCVLLPYKDEHDKTIRNRLRLNLNKEDGERFKWGQGDTILPYGLHNLKWIHEQGYCILVEGEVDAEVLLQHGFPALGIPGAATWKPEWAKYLPETIIPYIWQESDGAGEKFTQLVAKDFSCQGNNNELWGTLLVIKAPEVAKDAARLKKFYKDTFKTEIEKLLDVAPYAISTFPPTGGFEIP